MVKRNGRSRKAPTGRIRKSLDELRLTPGDRLGGATTPRSPRKRAKSTGKPRRKSAAPRRRRPRRGRAGLFGRMVYLGAVMSLWATIAVLGVIGWHAMHLPPPEELAVPERPANIMVLAADGSLIGNRGETGGEEVRLFELPRHVPEAVIAMEDRRFYSHFGLDPIGLARATFVNLTSGGVVQGGSTITQQLAKNLFLEPDRTFGRKVQELVLGLWLEYRYSKDEILEMYLNRIYLGAGATGVEAAARVYYNKSARDLTLAEAATLAGLVQAPSRYAPTRNPEIAEARAQIALAAMLNAGYITENDAKLALLAPAKTRPASPGGSVGYVADWVAEQTPELIGDLRRDIVVDTTVDARLQRSAEGALIAMIDGEGAERRVREGAVVAMSPDGAVRALVGGRDYVRSQFNRAVKAKRQPGSAFKPFVYLAAVESGLVPETLRTDAPIRFGDWSPGNYTNDFDGPIPLSDALARSVNTVAVRLTAEVGAERVIEAAKRLGIGSALQANLSIALGTSEVTPLELVAAMAPLANGGYGVSPYVITRIRTAQGDVLYQRSSPRSERIVSEEALGAMNYMMRGIVDGGTGRHAALPGRPAAGKTGTSQGFRDAWFVGYTANLVAGVWLGNDDGTSTDQVTGGSLPARIWRAVMEDAHEGVAVAELPGHYTPLDDHIVVDRSLPWLAEEGVPQHVADEPSQPVPPPSSNGGGFRIDGGFLSRLFGG